MTARRALTPAARGVSLAAMEFGGTATEQFRQVGNAVPPLLGEAIARAIAAAIYPAEHVVASVMEGVA